MFLNTQLIPDFEEKMENDVYPDNTLIVLENIYQCPSENGFTIDEENQMVPLTYDDT